MARARTRVSGILSPAKTYVRQCGVLERKVLDRRLRDRGARELAALLQALRALVAADADRHVLAPLAEIVRVNGLLVQVAMIV